MEASCSVYLPDAAATEAAGAALAACCRGGIIYLHGNLGAGKTTLVRGLLHGLGHSGKVKSPTYTLLESYQTSALALYHFDLYRLADPEELEYLGLRDYLEQQALCLIEWPRRGEGMLPPPDLSLQLSYQDNGRRLSVYAGAHGEDWARDYCCRLSK